METIKPIHFQHGRYTVKSIFSDTEQDEIFRLRARVFCAELAWVGNPTDTHEIDEFDDHSTSIAVIDAHEKLVATLRLTPPGEPWMLHTYFQHLLVENADLRTQEAWEVTRLAVAGNARSNAASGEVSAADLLFQGLFQFCVVNNIRFLDMVVSRPIFRYLNRRGLYCDSLSMFANMPDGATAGVAQLDWLNCLEDEASLAKSKWYFQSNWESDQLGSRLAFGGGG